MTSPRISARSPEPSVPPNLSAPGRAPGHHIEVADQTADQPGAHGRVAGKVERIARRGQRGHAIGKAQFEARAFEDRERAVDAFEAGERTVLPDVGRADAPVEIVETGARGMGSIFAGEAAAVLPRNGGERETGST